jgi:hypothetical protein
MLITKYFPRISNDPLPRLPPRLRVAASVEQGKGVINMYSIIVLCMITDTQII